MQKILVGVILLIVVYVPIILSSVGFDFFSVNLDSTNSALALVIFTFMAGAIIYVGIDEYIDDKFNPWN